jgi:hypothetical protein
MTMRMFHSGILALAVLAAALAGCSREDTVVSQDGGFKATFPVKAQTTSMPVKSGELDVTMNMVAAEKNGASFVVSYVDYPAGSLAQKSSDQAFQDIIDGTLGNVQGTLRNAAPITLGGTAGREVLIDVPAQNVVVHERIFLVGDRLYQVMYGGPKGTENANDATAFLDSFKLMP